MSPKEEGPKKVIGGTITLLGQWSSLQVIIIVAADQSENVAVNPHVLPSPFQNEKIRGKVLLLRMDDEARPEDFTVEEYNEFVKYSLENPQPEPSDDDEEEEESEGDEDEDESEEDDEVEFLSEEEEEIENIIMCGVIQNFKEMEGRDPTDEELGFIYDKMNESGKLEELIKKYTDQLPQQDEDDESEQVEEKKESSKTPKGEKRKSEGVEAGEAKRRKTSEK